MSSRDAPIGVFDSGLGGLSVAHEIRRRLPDEDIVYIADSAHRHIRAFDVTADGGIDNGRILLDLSAGIDPTVLRFARAADKLILVTTDEPTALTDAYATAMSDIGASS